MAKKQREMSEMDGLSAAPTDVKSSERDSQLLKGWWLTVDLTEKGS